MNERLTDEQLLYLLRQVDIQAMRIPSGVRKLADLICEKILNEALSETAELRRLHALCEEMGEALSGSFGVLEAFESQSLMAKQQAQINRAVLTKWKESK